MKKHLLLIPLLASIMGSNVQAQTVSEADAYAKAADFLCQNGRRARGEVQLQLAYKSVQGKEVHYYVFNKGENDGFVIVGGDERATEILGYSNNGAFDYESAPDNFKWWLSLYDNEIHQNIVNNVSAEEASSRHASARGAVVRADVPDLITTKWSQGAPFNNMIPSRGEGYSASVTGCVATAMAQVMNYHEWPVQGTGSHTYTDKYGREYSADFSSVTYDWANMLDSYNSGYTTTEANAVATLMYHCGVSVDMNYAGSSGASSADLPNALSAYFGYDKSALCLNRNYYTDEEWFDLVYGELAAGRPLLYGGQDSYGGGGHEFVCHGYRSSDNTYAINWGWAGYCDGNFTMVGKDGLQPKGSGIGGAGEGASYTTDQDIIINVKKDAGGSYGLNFVGAYSYKLKNLVPYLTYNGEKVNSAEVDKTEGDKTFSYTCYPQNSSAVEKSFQLGVMLRDKATGTCYATGSTYSFSRSLGVGYYYSSGLSVSFSTSIVPVDGVYEVFPAVRETSDDEWQLVRQPTCFDAPAITITGGQPAGKRDITFSISDTSVPVRSTIQITHDELYDGDVTYSSSPTGIVSIDENGVVKGLVEGTTTIKVVGEPSVYFNKTEKEFKVTVTPYINIPIDFTIDSEEDAAVGDELHITHTATDYTGTITYTSSKPSVASVDSDGTILALAPGKTTITAYAPADALYLETTKTFEVTVTGYFTLVDYSMANQGYFTPSTVKIKVNVKNGTGITHDYFIVYCIAKVGNLKSTGGISYRPWPAGMSLPMTFDFDTEASYFQNYIGRSGTFTFMDNDKTYNLHDPIPFHICNELSINHTMTNAGWSTICLPFEAEVPEGLTAYSVTAMNGSELVMESVTKMEMNTPYLLSGTAGTYSFVGPDTPTSTEYRSGLLVGNTVASAAGSYVYAPEGSYVLQLNDGVLGFYKVKESGTQKIRQYSAYLQLQYAEPSQLPESFTLGDVESIEEIEAEVAETENLQYNLNGQAVGAGYKGLVIKNGKVSFQK